MSTSKTVGEFTLTVDESGDLTVSGPASYMRSAHYADCIAKIEAGQSAVINYAPSGSDFITLIGVAIQTDYAGWSGLQSLGLDGRS